MSVCGFRPAAATVCVLQKPLPIKQIFSAKGKGDGDRLTPGRLVRYLFQVFLNKG